MGLSIDSTRFLMQAQKSGVRFDETLTLGRQHMMVSPERLEAFLREYGAWPPPEGETEFRREMSAGSWRFETLARALGAKNVSSMDASAYEGATLVHDLNQSIPSEWQENYDLVVDGGTLEHVFNFPVAIANCMKLVKTGGHLILLTPTNNYCGHGFYQFSPELIYRVLARENGFQVLRMIGLAESIGQASLFGVKYPFLIRGPWYSVRDPAEVRKRVELINHKPTLLMVLAKKISREAIFAKTPQQSDYVPQWQQGANANPMGQSEKGGRTANWLRSMFSESFCREVLPQLALILNPFRLARFRRQQSFHNKESFQRLEK